jgi:peptide/nickel transport system substrate-binding protein
MAEVPDVPMNARAGRMSRRTLLRRVTLTGTSLTGLALLAACGPQTAPTAPTAAPAPAQPTATTAAAASKPTAAPTAAAAAPTTAPTTISAPGASTPAPASGGQAAAPANARRGGTLVVANEADMNEGDPQKYSGTHAGRTLRNIFDPLVTVYDDSSTLRGGLAESYDVSPDGLTYTFKLRDTTFHDGTPVTAEAVAFTFLRTLDESNQWYQKTGPFPFAKYIWPYVVTDQIKAVDPRTLRFQLSQPDSTFLDNLTWAGSGIISPPALQAAGRDFTLHPVGAGPFKFSDWQKGTSFTIERFDKYWGGAPLLDKVTFKPVEESAARLVQLQSGNVDLVVALPPEFIAQVKGDPNLNLIESPGIHIWWITLNTNDEHFKDKRVRQAVNYAIDKQSIINDILAGSAVVSHSFAFPNTPAFTDQVQQYPYDPQKAKDLLAEAGVAGGFSTVFLVPESGSGMIAPKEIATVVQAQLAQVGVQAQIQTMEWTSYISAYNSGLDKAAGGAPVGMAQMSYMIPQPDPGMYAYDVLGGKGSLNPGSYQNADFDQLLLKAKGMSDATQRVGLYKQAQQLVADDAPWIFMFHANNVVAANKKVQNIVLNPDFNILHLERVWLQ